MSRKRRPWVVGWEDQVRMVLRYAPGPLSTNEVGARARVIPTGRYADPDLSKRTAGDCGQDCYRILVRLEKGGFVTKRRFDGSPRIYWEATPKLRSPIDVAAIKESWNTPLARRDPPPRRRRA